MEQDVTMMAGVFKLWAWFDNNRKQATWILCGIVVVACAVGFYYWDRSEREVNAGNALSQAVLAATLNEDGKTEPDKDFLKVASDYHGTAAAGYALLQAGTSQFQAGNYADAQLLFLRMVREYPTSPFVSQGALGLAACQDAQGKVEEAAQAYKAVVDRYPDSVVIPQAKFALARIYETQGRFAEALGLYEAVLRSVGLNSSLGSEAGMRGADLQRRVQAMQAATPAHAVAPSAAAAPKMALTSTNVP